MPKVPTSKSDSGSASGILNGSNHPNVLKRNQACHQCRRRKLKCDAQRPCSTCVRSHAHARTHAPAGVILPDHPDCTFDEVPGQPAILEPAKNRYEKLENRINELEAMLKESRSVPPMSALTPPGSGGTNSSSYSDTSILSTFSFMGDSNSNTSTSTYSPTGMSVKPVDPMIQYEPPMQSMGDSFNAAISPGSNPATTPGVNGISSSPVNGISSSPLVSNGAASMSGGSSFHEFDVVWPNWPKNLPQPQLLRHLVEIFFAFHPHAGRLFHGPSFMSSLTLPPTHPKFPSTAVLHAICAVGSLYTVAVVPTPQPNLNQVAPGGFCEFGPGYQPLRVPLDEIFNDRHKSENHVDSFAEQQVKFARQAWDHQLSKGLRLLEIVQAQIICNWWYWGHAKWVELFMISAQALRTCIPLGLNTSTPFQSIADSLRAPTILPPPEDVTEEEMRRNTFWLAYSMERQHGCSNGWALSLDESDVTQMLPVKGELFDFGTPATPDIRQWSHTKNVLLTHPDDQTDSFTLYIKANMLLSRVKAYNLRFRSKRFKGDQEVAYDPSLANYWEQHHTAEGYPVKDLSTDPRRTPLFIEIDRIAMSFRASFPHHLRNPMPDGVVDSHLYTAHLIPHVAIILLHDPHAHVGSAGCMSAFKILEAARAVLDLIYAVQSTSYDITLLDYFCAFCWFMAGRVLVRFWHAAQEAKSEEQTITLRAEVEYIASAITKFGERIPLAYRYSRMLNDIAYKTCGEKIYIQL